MSVYLSSKVGSGGGGSSTWGSITGTLSNQTDLQNALNAKVTAQTTTDNAFFRANGTSGQYQNSQTTEDDNGVVKAVAIGSTEQDRNLSYFNDFAGQTGTSEDFVLSGFVKNNQYETEDYIGFIRPTNNAFSYFVHSLSTVGGLFIGGGEITIDIGVVIKSLADATNDYIMRIGLFDDVAAAPQNGVYVRYQRSSATWELVTIAGGVSTVTSLGLTPTADDHEKFIITINADATSVTANANGGSFVTPHTTNIPTGVRLMEGGLVQRVAGTSNSVIFPDWYGLNKIFTNNRYTS